MDLVETIDRLCKEKGVSRRQMEREAGLSVGTSSKWKAGFKPNSSSLLKLANYFGVPYDTLLCSDEPNITGVAVSRPVVTINVYGTIPAGIPVEAIEDIIDTEQIPAEWLSGRKEYFALKVKGDSMYPVYLDGDIVIVRKQTTCRTGDDCVVYVNGFDATLKRVKLHDDGGIEIVPLNTNYAPRTYSRAEAEQLPISIGGVVVELRRKIQ